MEAVGCSQQLSQLSNTGSQCKTLHMGGQVHVALRNISQHDRAAQNLDYTILYGASTSTLGAASLAAAACRQCLSWLRSTSSQWKCDLGMCIQPCKQRAYNTNMQTVSKHSRQHRDIRKVSAGQAAVLWWRWTGWRIAGSRQAFRRQIAMAANSFLQPSITVGSISSSK